MLDRIASQWHTVKPMSKLILFSCIAFCISCTNKPKEINSAAVIKSGIVEVSSAVPPDTSRSKWHIESFADKSATTPQPSSGLANIPVALKSVFQILQEDFPKTVLQVAINPRRDTTIEFPKGTRLIIPAYAFETVYGNSETLREVNVSVEEYYTLGDFVFQNLTTSTESEILETGGMVNVTAHSNGVECVMAEGMEIEIRFPAPDTKENMRLFTGKRDATNIITWTTNNSDLEPPVVQIIDLIPESLPQFPGGYQKMIAHLRKNLKYPSEARRAGAEGTVFVKFIVLQNGDVTSPAVIRSADKRLDKAAVDAIMSMPRWLPGRVNDKPADLAMVLQIRFSLDGGSPLGVTQPDEETIDFLNDFEKSERDSILKEASAADVSFYVLRTSKLGWINCDRFLDVKNPITFKVYLPASDPNATTKLIFNRFRSVLEGERVGNWFHFRNVAPREKVTVLALASTQDGLTMTTKESTTGSKPDSLSNLKPVTSKILRATLEKLED
jgi:TonB family protein